MPIKSLVVFFVALSLLNTACDIQVRRVAPATTLLPVTPTFRATQVQPPSETPLPPPPQPTTPPVPSVDGVTSTQVNVRAEPSTAGTVLGIIPADMRVEITGKDPGENWWQINYPQGIDGKGWVTAQYVVASNRDQIPTIGGEEADINEGPVAVIQQQINVRSGPGTGFNSLGTLNPQDVVELTGKDAHGAWLQISFAAGPEGKGWVNAAFVQAQGVEDLPIIAETGQVVGTGTPTEIPPTPTITIVPAREDNDASDRPLVSVTFEPTGTRTLIYNGDVSAPDGDPEDWIQFTSFSRRILLEAGCKGAEVYIELSQNGQTLQEATCAAQEIVSVEPDQPVLIQIRALSESTLRYSSYTLKVAAFP